MKKHCLSLLALVVSTTAFAQKWSEEKKENYSLIKNQGGQTLGYAAGTKILTVNGLAFKDLNKNGKLDAYEDWRLPAETRAKDLARQLSVEQIAG